MINLICDQLAGRIAIKQCTCNRRLLTSVKVQIQISINFLKVQTWTQLLIITLEFVQLNYNYMAF